MAAALIVAAALAACGDDDDDGADPPSVTSTTPETAAVTLASVPDEPADAGTVIVAIADVGGDPVVLDIDTCTIDNEAEPDGEVPLEFVAVTASGSMDDGTEVHVDIRRFRSQGASPTITDTISIAVGDPDEPERALVAQRFEVDGLVTDLRDADADDPLLRVADNGVEGRGLFAGPGEIAGVVEGFVRATCP